MFSPLTYQHLPMSASHYTYRARKVDAVVIHYTASIVRDARYTVQYWEQSNPYTSANYIIDVSGRISSVIPEERRAFTSSSWGLGLRDIDDHAITIECSCDYVPDNINRSDLYTESEATLDACAELLADIGIRYGIEKWSFTYNEDGNIHAHRWYDSTPCPGDYLYSRLGMIADSANQIMESKKPMTTAEREEFDELKANVEKLATSVDTLATILNTHTVVRFNSLDDIPEWGRTEISWLLGNGYLKGTDAGLQLNYDMLRTLIIVARILMKDA